MFVLFLFLCISCVLSFNPENCGLSGPEFAQRRAKIAGGHSIFPTLFPWVAGLMAPGSPILCTGSLISEKHVLLSAHCFKEEHTCNLVPDNTRDQYFICHGALRNNRYCPLHMRYNIERTDFLKRFLEGGCYEDDIALITLEREVKNVVPICLPIQENGELRYNTTRPRNLISVAYTSDKDTEKLNNNLKMVDVGKQEECKRSSTTHICTRPAEDITLCGSASGGFLAEMHDNRYVIVGVHTAISNGWFYECGHPKTQDISEAVAPHLDEIVSIVKLKTATTTSTPITSSTTSQPETVTVEKMGATTEGGYETEAGENYGTTGGDYDSEEGFSTVGWWSV